MLEMRFLGFGMVFGFLGIIWSPNRAKHKDQGGPTAADPRTTPRDLAWEGKGRVNPPQGFEGLEGLGIGHLPLHALRPEASADLYVCMYVYI